MSKYWLPFQIFACISTFLIAGSVLFLPESPKYLISKKKYDEARDSLRFIAKLNRNNDPVTFKFDREVIDNRRGNINMSTSRFTDNETTVRAQDPMKSPISQVKEE